MSRIQRLLVSLVAVIAATVGTTTLTAAPAHATDGYGTNFSMQSGYTFPWGPYSEIIFTKSLSEKMKNHLVAGETVSQMASFACGLIPGWIPAIACVGWVAFNASITRDAVNDAHANGNKCFAIRWYSIDASNVVAKHAASVTCNYGVQCCSGGSGGGGGGGGGGSWRQSHTDLRHVTMDSKVAVGGSGSGGGSW